MTTGLSADFAVYGEVKRGKTHRAPLRVPPYRGGEVPAAGPGFFTMMRSSRGVPRLILGAALVCVAAHVQAQASGRPVVANVLGQSGSAGAAPGAVLNPPSSIQESAPVNSTLLLELRRLVEAKALSELRTTYNGQYGASLLFKPDDLTYYVALFQQRQFWRVLKSTDADKAEQLYRGFARQTEELSQVDIDRIRLDAERAHAEARIQAESAELEALRGNLAYQRQREREVIVAQELARQQAQALAAQEQAARERLKNLQQSIEELEAQQTRMLQADLLPGSRKK